MFTFHYEWKVDILKENKSIEEKTQRYKKLIIGGEIAGGGRNSVVYKRIKFNMKK